MKSDIYKKNSEILTYIEGKKNVGSIHPITNTIWEIEQIFKTLGYKIVTSPEIEKKEYNFDKLDIPDNHPSRSDKDTFYFNKYDLLLRTHTSNTEVRFMEKNKNKEIAFVVNGKVYRRDEDDNTHTHQFTQLEILKISKNTNLLDLKKTIQYLIEKLFWKNIKLRYRNSYFPFTEPSIEADLECMKCHGKGCPICKNTGWIEILGGGLIKEKIVKNSGYDESEFTAIAMAVGIERLIMIKYGLENIRELYNNNLKFLKYFQTNKFKN